MDRKLRMLQRLAERVDGPQLDRVLEMIAQRRREIERELDGPSRLWDDLPEPADANEAWRPGAEPFRPASRGAVPVRVRRPGERGYRIVGVKDAPRVERDG